MVSGLLRDRVFSSLEDDILFIVVTLKEIKTVVFLHKQLLTLGISDDDYTYTANGYSWGLTLSHITFFRIRSSLPASQC